MKDKTPQIHVLVVDDDAAMRSGLKRALEKSGFLVTSAANGHEALKKLGTKDYNLILMDLRMPQMDGFATLKQLRKQGNNIPVIIMTAFGDVKIYLQLKQLGIAEFINKPIQMGRLQEIIKTILSDSDGDRLSKTG